MDKTSYQHLSFEETNTGTTHQFPEHLPERTGPAGASPPWKRFWTFSFSSYSLIHTADGAARMRHIAMIAILLLRGAMSALSILSAVIKGSVWRIVVYSLLTALTMYFTATCLAIIGDAVGDRKLGRLVVKRWHLDTFLGICVVVQIVLIVVFFFGLGGWGLEIAGIGMWLAILIVAWIAGWQPELPTYHKRWASGT